MSDLLAHVDTVFDETVDTRRAIHAAPELAFSEHATTGLIRDRLARLGIPERPAGTATGAVGLIEGGRPGRTVLLRADIDALPIIEETDVPFRSRTAGVMHACGHDAHTAMLLGVASVLSARAGDLPGRYALLFQPAEEALGGARAMIDGGVLDGLGAERAISLHIASRLTTGLIGYRAGTAMSSAQFFDLAVSGTGGHAASNDATGNVVLAAAALASRLPRVVDGLEYMEMPCICSAGALHAGTANNVIPRHAHVSGSLRTFTEEQYGLASARLEALCGEVDREFSVSVEPRLAPRVPAVTNDADATATAVRGIARVAGEGTLVELPPMQPSDDVSEFLLRIPGTHMMIGAHSGPGLPALAHAPDFDIDEQSLRVGTLAMAAGAMELARPD